jgi:hypothetical protein
MFSAQGGQVSSDGRYVEFTPSGATHTLEIKSKAVSGVVARAFDKVAGEFMFDMSDATTTEYEATGATFVSSVDNTTALTIGTGDTLDVEFTLKASNLYTDAFDMGAYVLVEAPVTDYDVDTMSVSFDGQALTAVDLSGKESTAYNAYEKVYKIPANLASEILGGSGTGKKLRVTIDALSDVNADDDVVVALASIGSVQEINSNNLRYSSVSDASSPSAVYTLQSFTIDIQ